MFVRHLIILNSIYGETRREDYCNDTTNTKSQYNYNIKFQFKTEMKSFVAQYVW